MTAADSTVVVDLGCCDHDGDDSIGRLISRHHPLVLYGFDPLLPKTERFEQDGTAVFLVKKAAWVEDGEGVLGIGAPSLLNATLLEEKKHEGEWGEEVAVSLFDFGAWLLEFSGDEKLILKMNIEGAEFPLLEDLHARELDRLIDLLYVSWHDERMDSSFTDRRRTLQNALRCEIQPWELW